MLKRYRLKKDLPFAKTGTIFYQHAKHCNRYYPDIEFENHTDNIPEFEDLHGFTWSDMCRTDWFEKLEDDKELKRCECYKPEEHESNNTLCICKYCLSRFLSIEPPVCAIQNRVEESKKIEKLDFIYPTQDIFNKAVVDKLSEIIDVINLIL